MKRENEVIVVGGGLSGLALAWFLRKKGINALVLEAADRLGGRIQTVSGPLQTPLELGATWFSDIHPNLLSFVRELGLTRYPQFAKGVSIFQTKSFEPAQKFFVPESEAPSYRIAGGTGMLIQALSDRLPAESVKRKAKVIAIRDTEKELTVNTEDGNVYRAGAVISCLPPQLAAAGIEFSPTLPTSLFEVLSRVQTWMAGAIKFALEYEQPFWRKAGYSGMLYSHAGIIVEMYDHTNFEENRFGLTGFLNGSAASFAGDVRKALVLDQLSGLMGAGISSPVAYYDKVWNDGFLMAGADKAPSIARPHQNNGHPALHLPYMNGRLHFCGTETSTLFPGYMEGAIVAARAVAEKL